MSHYYRHASRHGPGHKDFYEILKVPYTATTADIKASYRKLALKLHPDTQHGCSEKTAQFKLVSEAYTVLTDERSRSAYDMEIGNMHHRHNYQHSSHRRKTSPFHYRSVYKPRPPPNWTKVWDHQVHYDMHYGDGMQREAIKNAVKDAIKEGAFEYKSPLGKGFTFSREDDDPAEQKNKDGKQDPFLNRNPYAKYSPQGPPKLVIDYEEGYTDMSSARQHLQRKTRIVQDMYSRRTERYEQDVRRQQQGRNGVGLQRDMSTTMYMQDHLKNESSCVIL